MHDVFVYGTLKRGFPNYSIGMPGARFVGRYRSVETLPLVVGGAWYTPYLIDEPGTGHRVFGEIFNVTSAHLSRLDSFESTHLPNGYKRREIQVTTESGGDIRSAWAYLKDRASIEGIHCDPMPEYLLDRRYVEPGEPRRNG